MSHWTINEGELRRNVGMQSERYRELRRRGDEARLLATARLGQPTLLDRLDTWLKVTLSRARQQGQYRAVELEQRHG